MHTNLKQYNSKKLSYSKSVDKISIKFSNYRTVVLINRRLLNEQYSLETYKINSMETIDVADIASQMQKMLLCDKLIFFI